MKFWMNNKYFRWGITALLVIIGSILFYYLLFHGMQIELAFNAGINVLMPLIFGMSMAYLMTPVLNFTEYRIFIPLLNKCKIKDSKKRRHFIRAISIIVTIFLFFAIIYSIIAMLVSQIVPSISNIVANLDVYLNNFIKWLDNLLSNDYPDLGKNLTKIVNNYSEDFQSFLNENVLSKTSEFIKTISLSVINVFKLIWNVLLGLMISVYMLASKEKFSGQAKKLTYALFKTDTANIIINNFRFTHRTFIGFLSGKTLDSIIIGFLCFVGTSLLQTPYAILVSVVVGVTNVIPVFGPYLGAIPSIILIFVVDPMHPLNCVYFALFILILQQFDGNVLGPKILGDSTGLAGFWVIFSITLFGGIYGVMGMVVGVPVFAVIYAAIRSFINTLLRKKNIPCDSKSYINIAAIKDNEIYEYIPEYKMKKEKRPHKYFGKEFLFAMEQDKITDYTSNFDSKSQENNSKNTNQDDSDSLNNKK